MKIKDPSLKEMEAFLEQNKNAKEASDEDIAEAIYWFAENHNEGMGSNLYEAKCQSDFRPSRRTNGIKGVTSEAVYNLLSIEYAGIDLQGTKDWNKQARAAYAIQAIKAYAKAKDEGCGESDIQDLISDLLHLKALIYDDPDEDEEAKASETVQSAFENYVEENDRIDHLELIETLDVQVEHQRDLVTWLKEVGRTDPVEWMKPKKES